MDLRDTNLHLFSKGRGQFVFTAIILKTKRGEFRHPFML